MNTKAMTNRLLLVFAVLVVALTCWISWSPGITGDGMEYLTMSEAFVRHGTPDLRRKDVEALVQSSAGDGSVTSLGNWFLGETRIGYPGKDSRFYSYHFWLYSLISAPSLALCQWLEIPPSNSFLLTNAALLLGALALILFLPNWRLRRKIVLVLLALACGSTFYLRWPGPEAMCFSMLLAGLLLVEAERYGFALFALAMAAQQNPPIGFFAVVAGLLACWQAFLRWREGLKTGAARALLRLVPGALMLIASPLFYWVEFGTPNLIMKTGGSDASLISVGRLVTLFFGVNHGMILAMPGVFLVVTCLLAVGLTRPRRSVLLALALVVMMALMAVPATTGPNWNAGELIIMRYAYWISVPLIYTCAMLMESASAMAFAASAAVLVVSQATMLAYFGVRGTKYSYVETSPVAEWLLRHHPTMYVPQPEVFAERGLGSEGVFPAQYSYFYVYDGYLVTILARNRNVFALDVLCHVDQRKLRGNATELGWRYRYLKRYCPLDWPDGFYAFPDPPPPLQVGKTNSMGAEADYASHLLPGFGKPERWGTWTTERFAALPLLLPRNVKGRAVARWRIAITFRPFVRASEPVPVQHVMVFADRTKVLDLRFTKSARKTSSFIAQSRPWLETQDSILLVFRIPTAASYQELGLSHDTRRMGIGLISVRADPVP